MSIEHSWASRGFRCLCGTAHRWEQGERVFACLCGENHARVLLGPKRCKCGCGGETQGRTGRWASYLRGHDKRTSPVDYIVVDTGYRTPCWIWKLGLNAHGYGNSRLDGICMSAHRAYFIRYRGPVPQGMQLDHLCKVRCCVNPDHLDAVSPAVNVRRGLLSKLSRENVVEIRQLLSKGERISRIAKHFRVSRGAVGHIQHRRTWREV